MDLKREDITKGEASREDSESLEDAETTGVDDIAGLIVKYSEKSKAKLNRTKEIKEQMLMNYARIERDRNERKRSNGT